LHIAKLHKNNIMWFVLSFEQVLCFTLQVQVAVKKLKPHVLSNAVDLREFLSEANTLRRLKHRWASLAASTRMLYMPAASVTFIFLTFARRFDKPHAVRA